MVFEGVKTFRERLRRQFSPRAPLLQQAPGHAGESVSHRTVLQVSKLPVTDAVHVQLNRIVSLLPRDAVNPPVATVPLLIIRIVAVLRVRPVDDIDRAIRSGL